MKDDNLKLTPLISFKAMERDYYRVLKGLTNDIIKSFTRHSMATYGRVTDASPASQIKFVLNDTLRYWQLKSKDRAKRIAASRVKAAVNYVDAKYKASLGIDFKPTSKSLQEEMQARFYENIRLITSVPQQIFNDFSSAFYNDITQGDRQSIMERLETIAGISRRRALFIARDQTAKMLEGINVARSQELGLEYYKWSTASDERVSTGKGGHRQLNNKIFRYDTPEAIIDSYGHKGHPKQRPNCRCTARGIFLMPWQKMKKVAVGYILIEDANIKAEFRDKHGYTSAA